MTEARHPGTGGGGGADVKSGTVTVTCGTSVAVSFTTAFASTPDVVACVNASAPQLDLVRVKSITTSGFDIQFHKGHGGSTHVRPIDWIATDAGDP